MAITEEQRELRMKYVGSSDSAAIMGLDPYRSAGDIFLEKTGQVDPFVGNEHTDRGNWLEPVLLKWAEKRLNAALVSNVMRVHPKGVLAANFDGYQPAIHVGSGQGEGPPGGVQDEPFLVEAKTSVNRDEWGEEDFTDHVPNRVIVQVQHQFALAPECRVAYVPVLLPGFKSFDWRIFRITRNDDLIAVIDREARHFWAEHVEKRKPPSDFRPSIEVLKRIRRQPNKTVPLAADLVDTWELSRSIKKDAEAREEEARRAVLTALGDAEGGMCDDGRTVTYLESARKGYEVAPCTFRQLRLKAAKEK